MTARTPLMACLLLAAAALSAPLTLPSPSEGGEGRVRGAGEQASDYLTKDGQLRQALEVRDVQGGFAGFTGRQWTIEPSGKWTVHRVLNKPVEEEGKGELSKEQLAALAAELARYGLKDLPTKKLGRPMANPHEVTIKFGKQTARLTLGAGQPLPKIDPNKPRATVEGRYSGIVQAVQKLLPVKKDKPGKSEN
ncbi:MAG: hypothetical protein L0Z62_24085 [Gemmataceae bacterium]|nr:hypothetical protein [Gemmataceae bacterium]